MKVQTPAEGMGYDKDDWCVPMMRLNPAFDDGSCKDSNIA